LFLNGVNFNPLQLFPSVSVPVSSTTPMLSSLVLWDHSDNWAVPTAQDFIALGNGGAGSGSAGSFEIDVSSANSEDTFLTGHVIDGRVLFPATGYLVLAWRQLAKLMGQSVGQFPVAFENVGIHRATILPSSGRAQLRFAWFKEQFESLPLNVTFALRASCVTN
jgi:fatty acid synthase, animal type